MTTTTATMPASDATLAAERPARREWSRATEARVQGVCGAFLALFVALGAWAALMAADKVPAMPWSPLGQAHHQEQTRTPGTDPHDPFGDLDRFMHKHHLKPAQPAPDTSAQQA